jgi:hypothetical protein
MPGGAGLSWVDRALLRWSTHRAGFNRPLTEEERACADSSEDGSRQRRSTGIPCDQNS